MPCRTRAYADSGLLGPFKAVQAFRALHPGVGLLQQFGSLLHDMGRTEAQEGDCDAFDAAVSRCAFG